MLLKKIGFQLKSQGDFAKFKFDIKRSAPTQYQKSEIVFQSKPGVGGHSTTEWGCR